MDREALAEFLRRRRERLTTADVGLPPGVRRRTPGLRRDEVASLAAISTDYYTRLEQRRGPHPSVEVLGALARALRLTDDERDHLFHLAGHEPPRRNAAGANISAGVLYLLDRVADCPAMVISDLGVVLHQNALSAALSGDAMGFRGRERSSFWRWFCVPGTRDRSPRDEWERLSRTHVADLRATYGRRGSDPDVADLVNALLENSEEFRRLWQEHDVAVRRADAKRIVHPEVGELDMLCEVLTTDGGQHVVVLYPRPGTDAREKLELLAVIGRQHLAPASPG